MLLAPDGSGVSAPTFLRQSEIMSFDFKQHPTERVRLSTQMQRPDHAAARMAHFCSVLDGTSRDASRASAGGIERCRSSLFKSDAGLHLNISGRIEILGNKTPGRAPTLDSVAIFSQPLVAHHNSVTKSEPLHSFRFVTSLDEALCPLCVPRRPTLEKSREPD
jgi:hypothetical protein